MNTLEKRDGERMARERAAAAFCFLWSNFTLCFASPRHNLPPALMVEDTQQIPGENLDVEIVCNLFAGQVAGGADLAGERRSNRCIVKAYAYVSPLVGLRRSAAADDALEAWRCKWSRSVKQEPNGCCRERRAWHDTTTPAGCGSSRTTTGLANASDIRPWPSSLFYEQWLKFQGNLSVM